MTETFTNEALSNHLRATDDQVAIAHGKIDQTNVFVQAVSDRLDVAHDKIIALEDIKGAAPDKLFKALSKAQAEFKGADLDATGQAGNRKYNYATLASVIAATREALSKNGLSVMQLPSRAKTGPDSREALGLTTILAHESGQSIENYFEMEVPDPSPQGVGSAMTYMRRYARMAILDISGANDDDAEGAQPGVVTLKPEQVDKILTKADELFGADADEVLERMCDKVFQVDAVAKIPIAGFDAAMNGLKNKKKREQAKKEPKKQPPKKDPEPEVSA